MRLKTYLNQFFFIISPIFALGSYITYIIYLFLKDYITYIIYILKKKKKMNMWEPFMGRLILTFYYKK